nr:immunoglobulin light chain junction region [Macaca mulatta]MOW72129.1 immunoglobulin light chain junction region [Macaca mulatta]
DYYCMICNNNGYVLF